LHSAGGSILSVREGGIGRFSAGFAGGGRFDLQFEFSALPFAGPAVLLRREQFLCRRRLRDRIALFRQEGQVSRLLE